MDSRRTEFEPSALRWKRRARTVPAMLAITAAGILLCPILALVAATADVARRRYRLPTVRLLIFFLQYAINDSAEILLAPIYWLLAGFGRTLSHPRSVRRHERLQAWSLEVLARRAERYLGLRLEIGPESSAVLRPGPVIVMCRHVNLVDASLPTLLYQRLGYRTRGVIMAELLADPGFDLIYGRTGSVFIPRDNGSHSREMLGRVGDGLDETSAVVIFPEGRLFRPDRLERALARLSAGNPDRAARLAGLRHVLPPRPGGVLALLEFVPGADVVVIAHTGLDRFATFRELACVVPLREPIRVVAWRVPAADIPKDDPGRTAWLDEQWIRVDAWIESERRWDGEPVARSRYRGRDGSAAS
jgi:1-acyl-sn-glycerol-3-phosphate acyltransferase